MELRLEQLQVGDPVAWNELYDELSVLILNILDARFSSIPMADLEDAMIRSITSLAHKKYADRVKSVEELKKVAITTAKNNVLDLLDTQDAEKRGAGKIESLEDQPSETDYESNSQNPAQSADERERHLLVIDAVNQLPENWRECIKDYYFEGLSYEEIAQKRGKKIGSICGWIARGKEALKPILRNLDLLYEIKSESR